MEFVRHKFGLRLGLTLWFAVALLVAVVPAWRLRAARQWDNARVQFAWNSDVYGLTPALQEAAARRFPDEAAAQLAKFHGLRWVGVGADLAFDNPDFRLAERKYFARYDALERRFSRSNAVRAQRLLDATRGPLAIDEGPQPPGAPRPASSTKTQPWLSQSALRGAVQSARRAAQIEPDNGFFPWMEAVFEFALKQDTAALAALERAGRCSRFDDYITQTVRDRLELAGRFRATSWEDEYSAYYSALLPHLTKMRSAARAAMGRARAARARGDETRALQITGIVMRAGALVARSDAITITAFSGAAIRSLAWQGAIEDLPDAPRLEDFRAANTSAAPFNSSQEMIERTRAEGRAASEQYKRALVQRFARYARENGRSDLAREALASADERESWRADFVPGEPPFNALQERAQALARAHWLGALALRLSVVGALLWLVLWPLSSRELSRAARRATLLAAMFSLGASAMLLVALSRAPSVVSFAPPQTYDLPLPPTDAFTVWLDNWPQITFALWALPLGVAVVVQRAPAALSALKFVGALLLLATLIRVLSSVILDANRGPNTFDAPLPLALPLALACAALGAVLLFRWARARQLLAPTAVALALWTLGVACSLQFFHDGVPLFEIVTTLTLALAPCALPFMLRHWTLRQRTEATSDPAAATVDEPVGDLSRAAKALAVAGVILGASVTWSCLRLPVNASLPAFVALFGALLGGALAAVSAWRLARARGDAKLAQLCFVGMFCAALLLSWSGRSAGHGNVFFNRTLATAFLALPCLGLLIGRDWWTRNLPVFNGQRTEFPAVRPRDLVWQLAARTRVAAGVLALGCAPAYLGIALWTVPVERQTRAQLQRQLQIGEVAWLREQIGRS